MLIDSFITVPKYTAFTNCNPVSIIGQSHASIYSAVATCYAILYLGHGRSMTTSSVTADATDIRWS